MQVTSLVPLSDLPPDLIADFRQRYADQPESHAEIVEVNGEQYVRLTNANDVLAVYDPNDRYIDPADQPELYQ